MASKKTEPVPRYGAFSFVHNNQFYVCQGKEVDYQYTGLSSTYYRRHGDRDPDHLLPLQKFDFSSAQWRGVSPVCEDPAEQHYWRGFMPRFYCDGVFGDDIRMCCAVLGNRAYTLGECRRFGCAVHELNLETMVWRRVETPNREEGPMEKNNAGMVACGDEGLCVFGGVGSDNGKSQHQPGATYLPISPHFYSCVTNELHLFHIGTGTWSSPETTGPRPPPCVEFSFTKVDLSRAVLFGGRKTEEEYMNELHILDMENWHWSGTILPSSPVDLWPQGTAQHSACALFEPTPSPASESSSKELSHSLFSDMSTPTQHNPQLFVLWGVDSHGHGIAKAWMLDINSISWKQVKLPSDVGWPRKFFSLGCHNRSSTETELVIFGGIQTAHMQRPTAAGGTTLLYMGVKALYHSCVDYVAQRYELYQPLLQQLLPPHIQTDIRVESDKRAHYRVVQL